MTSQCPNEFPSTSAAYRIALVGEAPGEREVALRRPFVGAAGAHLDRLLASCGILRSACFVGNVSQIRPPANSFDAFEWRGAEVQDGIAALLADLAQFRPNLIVTLGNVPLHLFRTGNQALPRKRRGSKLVYDWPRKVTTWRGSLFLSSERVWDDDVRLLVPSPEVEAACGGPPISAVLEPLTVRALDALSVGATPTAIAHTTAPPDNPRSSEPVASPVRAQWKCLSTLHPAYCLRAWAENFNLRQDLRRARAEGESPALVLPELDFQYGP